jgi:pimeloyl-ACP methyl ester carboxylesterase
MVSEQPRPAPLDQIPVELYPFTGEFFVRNGLRMHYLDEGEGEPVVMVHGNPTWSIYYRGLVARLRGRYRCIVPDHIGCGASDKPGDDRYRYTLSERVADLEALLAALEPERSVTLVLHDWGGMIGMAWAARHVERVKRLVLLNTAAFHLPETRGFHWQLRAARDMKAGALLVRGFNAFSWVASRTCCTRRPMSAALRRAYRAPYDSWDHRIATLRFVQDIPLRPGDPAYALVSEAQAALPRFVETPTLIGWGGRDFVFDEHFLRVWEATLPKAEVRRYPDCGHYVLEDAGEALIGEIEAFLGRTA